MQKAFDFRLVGLGACALTGLLLLADILKAKKIISDKEKKKKEIVKICITGGPCGGKSQGIACLSSRFREIVAPFFIVPEAATIIGSAGLTLDFAQFNSKQIELFQIYLMRLQYNLESIIQDIARPVQRFEKTPVMLCDRGLLDGKAYAGEKNWAQMLKHIKITQDDILERYQAVIHMQTAARGATEHYIYMDQTGNIVSQKQIHANQVRKQPPQKAIQLDLKIQNCYRNHQFRFIIRNDFFVKDFQIKKILLLAQVNQILSFILKLTNVDEYYNDFENARRKLSEDQLLNEEYVSPYLIRKRKYQKFMLQNQRQREKSPGNKSGKKIQVKK